MSEQVNPNVQSEFKVPSTDRPRRSAVDRTMKRIQGIREWETASESSDLFKRVAESFEEEFARENGIRKRQRVTNISNEDSQADSDCEEEEGEIVDSEDEDSNDEISNDEDDEMTAEDKEFVVSDEDEIDDEADYVPCSEPECSDDSEDETESDEEDCDENEWKSDEAADGSFVETFVEGGLYNDSDEIPELRREE